MTTRRNISYQLIDTDAGETLEQANDKINSFFTSLSSNWIGYIHQYVDADASQVINIPVSQLHPEVIRFLNNYWFDVTDPPNLVMEKIQDLPTSMQMHVYNNYFDTDMMSQKSGLGAEVRAICFDSNTGLFKFANGRAMFDTYSDITGILGNYYPTTNTVDLIINGLYYDFSDVTLKPGKTYFLSDSMPGWLIDYQEGGANKNVSVPMSVAVGSYAAILLTERAIVKDLPCGSVGQPDNLRFAEFMEYVDVTDGDPFEDPDVTVFHGYEPIGA